MSTAILWLPYATPPLNLNKKDHWAVRNRHVQAIKQAVMLRARQQRLPRDLDRIRVGLYYTPANNRVRDEDNLVPNLKAVCDALKAGTAKHPGYGMVRDDSPAMMVKDMPVITEAAKSPPGPDGSRLWVQVDY